MRGLWGGIPSVLELRILCAVGLCRVTLERYVLLDICEDGRVFFFFTSVRFACRRNLLTTL